MQRRVIAGTGVAVSVVGIGAWQIGGPDTPDGVGHGWGDVDDAESIKVIHCAQELGVNLIDTADIYGNGHSEEVIGRAVNGRRDRWVVATKGGLVKDPNQRGQYFDPSSRHIREACEASLRRLQTDHIDFYQLHGMPPHEMVPDTMRELGKLQEEGKVRFYGISTVSPDDVIKLREHGPVHIVQIGFNLLHRAEKPLLDYCARVGIGTFIRTPLMQGAAFGRYSRQRAPEFEFGDLRHGQTPEQIAEQHSPGLRFSFLWEGTRRTPAQAALRFVLDQPGVTAVIPGTRKIEHLEENCRAADVRPLNEGELRRADEIFAELQGLASQSS